MLKLLSKVARQIYFVQTDNEALVPAKELKRIYPRGKIIKSTKEMKKLISSRSDKIWLITGSIYFLGEIMQVLKNKKRSKVDKISDNQTEKK